MTTMATFLSASSKPSNVRLGTSPGGGTRPIRDPTGKTGSAALPGTAEKHSATTSTMNRATMTTLLRLGASLASGGPLTGGSHATEWRKLQNVPAAQLPAG